MLEAVLDFLPFAVVVYRRDGKRLFANAAAHAARFDAREVVPAALRAAGAAVTVLRGSEQVCVIAARTLVIAFAARPQDVPSLAIAAALFGLTPSEQRIAALLCAGNNAPQAAAALRCSLHTVHSHLKSIFAKTRTSSQNELIATLRGGVELFQPPSIKGCATKNNRAHCAPSVHEK